MSELKEKDGKLDTQSLLEDNFFSQFSKKGGKLPKTPPQNNSRPNVQTDDISNPILGNTEDILISAYEARDELIESFKHIQLGTPLSENIKTSINKVGMVISGLGGEVEDFDPLANMSGLNTPDMNKYASRVIENTIESYSLGTVKDAHLKDRSIIVTFEGKLGNTQYMAIGTITPGTRWKGTEAIDYIYTPGEGKMYVKTADENGRWVDSSDGYDISWELLEGNEEDMKKNIEHKEDERDLTENYLDNEISDDFPIEEK